MKITLGLWKLAKSAAAMAATVPTPLPTCILYLVSQLCLPSLLSIEYFNFDCCMRLNLSMLNLFSSYTVSDAYLYANIVPYPYTIAIPIASIASYIYT